MKEFNWVDCNREELKALIQQRESFAIYGLDWQQIFEAVAVVESLFDELNITWRTYTKGRLAVLMSALLSKRMGLTMVIVLLTHRILTFNPDYVIRKDFAFNKVLVVPA